jgi:hypothetical protein
MPSYGAGDGVSSGVIQRLKVVTVVVAVLSMSGWHGNPHPGGAVCSPLL